MGSTMCRYGVRGGGSGQGRRRAGSKSLETSVIGRFLTSTWVLVGPSGFLLRIVRYDFNEIKEGRLKYMVDKYESRETSPVCMDVNMYACLLDQGEPDSNFINASELAGRPRNSYIIP